MVESTCKTGSKQVTRLWRRTWPFGRLPLRPSQPKQGPLLLSVFLEIRDNNVVRCVCVYVCVCGNRFYPFLNFSSFPFAKPPHTLSSVALSLPGSFVTPPPNKQHQHSSSYVCASPMIKTYTTYTTTPQQTRTRAFSAQHPRNLKTSRHSTRIRKRRKSKKIETSPLSALLSPLHRSLRPQLDCSI